MRSGITGFPFRFRIVCSFMFRVEKRVKLDVQSHFGGLIIVVCKHNKNGPASSFALASELENKWGKRTLIRPLAYLILLELATARDFV
jgi:hypothetical protein